MPLPKGFVSVVAAQHLLQSSSVQSKGLRSIAAAAQHQQLAEFLARQRLAGKWEESCRALVDAAQHGVRIDEKDVMLAMRTCGHAKRPDQVRKVFYNFCKAFGITKTLSMDKVFQEACIASGDFLSAHRRMAHLIRLQHHQEQQLRQSSGTHNGRTNQEDSPPLLDDELVALYLEVAAKCGVAWMAPGRQTTSTSAEKPSTAGKPSQREDAELGLPSLLSVEGGGEPPISSWAAALQTFVAIRRSPVTRQSVPLTPAVLHAVAKVIGSGDQWRSAVRLVASAGSQQVLIPPEVFDIAVRCAWNAAKHDVVVELTRRCLASRNAPDETTVRCALTSSEEVAASGQDANVWRLATKLFVGLTSQGLPLFPQTYEAPLRACLANGRWDTATRILQEMKKDRRQVGAHLYRLVLLGRLAASRSYQEARALFASPLLGAPTSQSYTALLDCCIALRDWPNFQRVAAEMKHREIPETYSTIQRLIRGAYGQDQWHAAIARYNRLTQQMDYEKSRVEKDRVVSLHAQDFTLERDLLEMVLDSCEKMKDHRDPAVQVAHRDVQMRLAGGKTLLQEGSGSNGAAARSRHPSAMLDPWLLRNDVNPFAAEST